MCTCFRCSSGLSFLPRHFQARVCILILPLDLSLPYDTIDLALPEHSYLFICQRPFTTVSIVAQVVFFVLVAIIEVLSASPRSSCIWQGIKWGSGPKILEVECYKVFLRTVSPGLSL